MYTYVHAYQILRTMMGELGRRERVVQQVIVPGCRPACMYHCTTQYLASITIIDYYVYTYTTYTINSSTSKNHSTYIVLYLCSTSNIVLAIQYVSYLYTWIPPYIFVCHNSLYLVGVYREHAKICVQVTVMFFILFLVTCIIDL